MHFRTSFGRFAPTIPLVSAHDCGGAPAFHRTAFLSDELGATLRVNAKPIRSRPQIELQDLEGSTMKKNVQETFERALASFEKRQEDIRQRLREREKFETEWTE